MDHSAQLTASDGTHIWYGTVGDGPALVLCDGLACDGFIWPYVIDYFVEDFTLVRWHYRGHGASELPADRRRATLEIFCEDLAAVLDAVGADEAILAGHSMGVQVIFDFMRDHADRIRGLIPVCGSYKRPLDTFHGGDSLRRILPFLRDLLEAAPDAIQTAWETLLPREFWYQFAAQAAEVNGRLLRQEDFFPYLEHAAEMDLPFFLSMLAELSNHTTEDILPGLEAPTLIIAGENDTFTPVFRSREMNDLIPNSELVLVPGGTHVAPLELPDLVTAAMDKFLTRHRLDTLAPPRLPAR